MLQRSKVHLYPSDAGALSHNGTVTFGCQFNLLTTLYSSTGTPTMALGMKETPTYPMKTHMLLQDAGRITSTMNSSMSPVNYEKITISQGILAGFQYLPPSHIQKPSLPRGLTIMIPNSSQLRTQTMNLYCIASFVIYLTNTMNMAVIIILLNGIPIMGIHLVLPTKKVRTAPEAPKQLKNHLCSPVTIPGTVLAPVELPTEYYSLHSTRTLCRVTIQKSKGTKHCS